MATPEPPSGSAAEPRLPGAEREDLARMSFMEHLEELRRRLLRIVVVLVVVFAGCWTFVGPIVDFLSRPYYEAEVFQQAREGGEFPAPATPTTPEGTAERETAPGAATAEPAQPGGGGPAAGKAEPKRLQILGVQDAFVIYVKVAALAAIFVAAPYILFEMWLFVAPGLYRRERLWAFPFVVLGSGFFLSGGVFAYFVAFPLAVDFLLGLSGGQFEAAVTVERYFRFLITVILGLGLMFELPILIFLLAQMGVVTPRFLMRHFRWAVLIIFVVAAIITPTPDVVNLLVFAVPTVGLYLVGVGAAALAGAGKRKREADSG